MDISKGDTILGIMLAILVLGIFTGIGLIAGKEISDSQSKVVIVAEVSNGGFVIEDSNGKQTIIYWKEGD